MIIYTKNQRTIEKNTISLEQEIPSDPVWIDLVDISPEEEQKLEKYFKIDIPTPEETKNVSVSNRLYEKEDAIFMTITLYLNKKSKICNLEAHNITFIIIKDTLITIRDVNSKLFDNLLSYIKPKHIASKNICFSFLLILLENIINDTSAYLEHIGHHLDSKNDNIIRTSPAYNAAHKINYKTLLKEIANIGNSVSKTRESLITFSRMLNFLLPISSFNQKGSVISHIKTFLKDVEALSDQATFLSSKINFLLDATLGLINIEQNNIIKIFSVVSVIFMPPTLIASIYGMNFDIMPELKWLGGYPFALTLMLISSWIPYKYFKKKKWL